MISVAKGFSSGGWYAFACKRDMFSLPMCRAHGTRGESIDKWNNGLKDISLPMDGVYAPAGHDIGSKRISLRTARERAKEVCRFSLPMCRAHGTKGESTDKRNNGLKNISLPIDGASRPSGA